MIDNQPTFRSLRFQTPRVPSVGFVSSEKFHFFLRRKHLLYVFSDFFQFSAMNSAFHLHYLLDVSCSSRLRYFSFLKNTTEFAIGQSVPTRIVNDLIPYEGNGSVFESLFRTESYGLSHVQPCCPHEQKAIFRSYVFDGNTFHLFELHGRILKFGRTDEYILLRIEILCSRAGLVTELFPRNPMEDLRTEFHTDCPTKEKTDIRYHCVFSLTITICRYCLFSFYFNKKDYFFI